MLAIRMHFWREPGTEMYSGSIDTVGVTQESEKPYEGAVPTEIENLSSCPLDMFISSVHDRLKTNPDHLILMQQGAVDKNKYSMLPEDMRVLIRDDLEGALDQWAPTSRIVHVRKGV